MTDIPQECSIAMDAAGLADPLARTILDSLSAHVAILDRDGVILATNKAWQQYGSDNGMTSDVDSVGVNYLAICDSAEGDGADTAHQVADGIRQVVNGQIREFLLDYPCHSLTEKRWYYLRAIRMAYGGPVRIVVSHEDITALKLAEEALRRREEELENQKQRLEETNIALKVLLKQRESDKLELEQKVLTNVKQMVLPYVQKLKNAPLRPREKTFAEIIDAHLQDIVSPFLQRLTSASIILTPQELQVATLVKEGKTSKEIADILNVADTTVHFHRKNLRIKFGLKNRRANLRSYLLSLS